MSTEDEKWRENFAQNEGQEYNREGYKPYNRDNNRMYNNRNSYGDRQQRPYSGRSGYNNRNGYNKNGYQQNGGPRPYRPYNASEDGEQRAYRPRFNKEEGQESGRSSYNRPNRDYQSRSNNGYQPRERNGYQQREGGYHRSGGYQQQGGNSRPRYQQGGSRFGGTRPGQSRPRTADYDPNAKYSRKKQIEYKELNLDPDAPIRLNKFLANAGVCSRREADEFITAGVVSVNGEVMKSNSTTNRSILKRKSMYC